MNNYGRIYRHGIYFGAIIFFSTVTYLYSALAMNAMEAYFWKPCEHS